MKYIGFMVLFLSYYMVSWGMDITEREVRGDKGIVVSPQNSDSSEKYQTTLSELLADFQGEWITSCREHPEKTPHYQSFKAKVAFFEGHKLLIASTSFSDANCTSLYGHLVTSLLKQLHQNRKISLVYRS